MTAKTSTYQTARHIDVSTFKNVLRRLAQQSAPTQHQVKSIKSPYSSLFLILAGLLWLGQPNELLAQNPLAAAGKFNVFLATDAKLTTNESEGAVAIGGNLTVAGNYQVAVKSSATFFSVNGYPIGLVVGGGVKLQQGTLQVNSNTYAKIGACAGSSATDALKTWYKDNNGAYSTMRITKSTAGYGDSPTILINKNANNQTEVNSPVCQGNVIDFASSFTTLKSNSLRLAQNAARVKLTNANGQAISNTNLPSQVKIGLYTGINIWNVTGADLNKIQNLTYADAPSSSQVLVINVDAMGAFTWNTPSLGGVGGNNAPYILWNFYNTTQLTIGGNSTIEGSVLAPLADVVKTTNQSNIEGQLVANSFIQSGGEMHDYPFNSDLLTALPVRLVSLSASQVGNSVQLLWETSWEQNSAYFAIERSADAREFGTVGRVNAIGQSSSQQRYSFLDEMPLSTTAYYRLRMVDIDGSVDYSRIVAVSEGSTQPLLHLLSNPITDQTISVRLQNWTASDLRLVNSQGQPLPFSVINASTGLVSLQPLQPLIKGVYILMAQQGSQRQSVRVLVQ